MSHEKIETNLREGIKNWCLIGSKRWKEDDDGVIYPPKWSNPLHFRGHDKMPDNYAEPMARVDYAFYKAQAFDDIDIRVKYKCHIDSAISAGIIFRAKNSREFYILEIEDFFSGGAYYEMVLWKQAYTGYRYETARGKAPHSFNSLLGRYPGSWDEWKEASPDWIDIRIQAVGTFIRVSADGRIIIDMRDPTYSSGFTGLEARGAVCFKDLKISGRPSEMTWKTHEGELPAFFYPGGIQPYGCNACPVICRTGKGTIIVCWKHGTYSLRTVSFDEGRTWSLPEKICFGTDALGYVISIFEHRNGTVSFLSSSEGRYFISVSADNGGSWINERELIVCGEPLEHDVYLYSPMIRLSDGTVLITGYEAKHVKGGSVESNFERRDRSVLLFSDDDGMTWSKKTYIDGNNFDHNECMLVETGPGRLVAFMRPLLAPNMWTGVSEDYGRTWSPLEQSDVKGSSSYLIKHSSGKSVMFTRGQEAYIRTSADGKKWTKQCRISPCNPMVGMTETADGNIMIVMQEGFRIPAYIRGQVFSVTGGEVASVDMGIENAGHDYEIHG